MEEWVDIVAQHRQGLSIKAICRQLGVGRNTVRRALRREGPPRYRRAAGPSKLYPHVERHVIPQTGRQTIPHPVSCVSSILSQLLSQA